MNLQKYFSLKIHQVDLAAQTHETLCLPCGVPGDLLAPSLVEKIWTASGRGGVRGGGKGGGGTAPTNDTTAAAADIVEEG